MELNDLGKVLVGAKGFVEVSNFTPEGSGPIAIVDLFDHECYYKKNERAIVEGYCAKETATETKTIEDIIDNEDDEY